MVYVKDVASAMRAAADYQGDLGFKVYNVATGSSVSNNEILETLEKYFPDMSVTHAPERPGDVKHTLGSIDNITTDLGWSPRKRFWEGLRNTLQWWELIE